VQEKRERIENIPPAFLLYIWIENLQNINSLNSYNAPGYPLDRKNKTRRNRSIQARGKQKRNKDWPETALEKRPHSFM